MNHCAKDQVTDARILLQSTLKCAAPFPLLFALVIGIDQYRANEIRGLTGAVADANAVSNFLQETLCVPNDRIMNLRNENATRFNIEAEIERLANNSEIHYGDPILIFYAGHGAEAKAPSGWPSANGKIQMLLPHDFLPNGSDDPLKGQGVLDRRLSSLLASLAANKSDNIVVILDSCYSGSGTRLREDNESTVRRIDLSDSYSVAEELLLDIKQGAGSSVVSKELERASLFSHVLLSASKAEQVAFEKHGHGVFTLALLKFIRQHGVNNFTYKGVISSLPDLPDQNPQCEGIHQSRLLFDSRRPERPHELYLIRALSSDVRGQYIMEAGDAHGVTKDDEFAVFADKDIASSFNLDSALGTVVALNTTAFTTTCNFSRSGDEEPFSLADLGYALQTSVSKDQDVRIFIEPSNKRLHAIFKQIGNEILPKNRGFNLVENLGDSPDLVVATDGDHVYFEIRNEVYRNHTLARIPFEVKIDDLEVLHRVVRDIAAFYWNFHRSLESPIAEKVTLKLFALKPSREMNDKYEEVFIPDDSSAVTLNDGDSVSVNEDVVYGYNITSTAKVPLYISMFYFEMSDLSIKSYYQPGTAKASVDFSIPAAEEHLGKTLTIGYGASGTSAHVYVVPKGREVDVGFVKLFISTKPVDLSGIVQLSPFLGLERRKDKEYHPKIQHQCFTVDVALIQKKKKN
ncbi:caspase domain-containing protein [Armillaria novae-zelandiae]|uniref:Caspase domain-containing protein n=1 Tax=Armillaria novae-zelandiae TaxID=153914 RepID=A0AA39T855_9AGAR|nr:caspase domain-containing protein [Armillaria novae-zelandiae]